MPRHGHHFRACAIVVGILCALANSAIRAQDGLPLPGTGPQRQAIVVGLPIPQAGAGDELILQPNVDLSGHLPAGIPANAESAFLAPSAAPPTTGTLLGGLTSGVIPAGGFLPPSRVVPASRQVAVPPDPNSAGVPLPPADPEELPSVSSNTPVAEPMFNQTIGGGYASGGGVLPPIFHSHHDGTFYGFGGVEEGPGEGGVGHDRVMLAPFIIDSTQPTSNFRFRVDAGYREQDPDRAEYFWAQEGVRGPKLPERAVNYQDVYAAWEVATGKAFSVTTEIPIRLVAPDINPNDAGLGDVSVTTKTVLLTGNNWQITQIFRSFLPTDTPSHGTGNGHVSLEPGMLFRYKWTDETYFHMEAEYWFPLGAGPVDAGNILFYGFGITHLLYESDNYACIPTLEFVASTVFTGAQTQFPTGAVQPVDTMTIVNVNPGVRWVRDTGGDLGLIEYGVVGGFPMTPNRWNDAYLMLEVKFAF